MTRERIRVENVVKLFGGGEEAALSLLEGGAGKDAILGQTGAVLALDRVSFSVNEGEILVVMGLSGSGKSTVLRCINRLIEPTAGQIRVDGTDVTALGKKALLEFRREKFGMVFQHFALFPNRTIAENVEYGLEIQGVSRPKRRERALHAIELVGLKGWDAKYPNQLSGGMQQRAGLARALAVDADILLMDEAFSALDPLIRRDMQDELGQLQKNLGKTVVFVSHDLDEAIHLGGRIVLMKDGAIVQTGYPEEILLRPASDYVRRFVEHIDVSAVITLGRLVRSAEPVLFRYARAGEAYPLVRDRAGEAFIVTCEKSMPVGRITREALGRAGASGSSLDSLMDAGVATANAGDVLKSVLPKLVREPRGIAVVDDEGRYLGTVTTDIAVAALAGTAHAQPDLERDMPWIGPSPNSRWTTSATAPSTGSPPTFPH